MLLLERFDIAETLLYKSVELGEKNVKLAEQAVALGEESVIIGKKMMEKQDDTIEEIRALREDMKTYMENKFMIPSFLSFPSLLKCARLKLRMKTSRNLYL